MMIRLVSFLALLAQPLLALPVPPTSPIDIHGEVKRWAWIDSTTAKSDGEGLLVSIRTVPTYYLILKVESVPKEIRESLSWYASSQGSVAITHPIIRMKLENDEILIAVDLEFIENLKKGTKIEINGYTMQGDEWGCESDWTSMKLDSKEIPKRNRNAEKAEPSDGGKPSN